MTSAPVQQITTDHDGARLPVDNAAHVRVSVDDLLLLSAALRHTPGSEVPFTAEFEGTGVYARLSASHAQSLIFDSGEFIALTCHLDEIVGDSLASVGFALPESCTLLVPAALQESGGLGYLMPRQPAR